MEWFKIKEFSEYETEINIYIIRKLQVKTGKMGL